MGNAHRGVHVQAADGAYARVPVWSGREHWLTFVVPMAIAAHRRDLAAAHISAESLRQWALIKSGYAQARTGRRCIVRPDTIASVMGISTRHVERINAFARRIGLEAVVLTGRMLTATESFGARRRGSRQRGLSTEVALTIPAKLRLAVYSVTPTRGRATKDKPSPKNYFRHAASGEIKGAASRHRPQKRPPGHQKARRLAADLQRLTPWLRGEAPARMAPALSRFANATPAWTGTDIATALAARSMRTGLADLPEHRIRTRPAILLAHILREIHPYADHPRLPEIEVICTTPGCDHGWISADDGRVAKCPTCPNHARSNHLAHNEDWPVAIDTDPPF